MFSISFAMDLHACMRQKKTDIFVSVRHFCVFLPMNDGVI